MPQQIPRLVVAAVIERSGKYLVCKRASEKRHGGLWEFPGGKVDEGESASEALGRELREELGVEVEGVGKLLFETDTAEGEFKLQFYSVRCSGEPQAIEHEELRWVEREACGDLSLCPSDRIFWSECIR